MKLEKSNAVASKNEGMSAAVSAVSESHRNILIAYF